MITPWLTSWLHLPAGLYFWPYMRSAIAHAALTAYGLYTPDHPGKGSVIAQLEPLARAEWLEPVTVSRRYGKYRLDLNDMVAREIYADTYEPCESRLVNRLVRPDWVCVDAGANIGYFTIMLSRKAKRVIAFEPCADNRERLAYNLGLNDAKNVSVHPLALSDRSGQAKFAANRRGNLGGSMLDESGTDIVPVTTLDDFLAKNPIDRLDFIKADIEGSEVRFLRGARQTIIKYRPTVLVEINPNALAKFGNSVRDLCAVFGQHCYTMQKISWTGLHSAWPYPQRGEYCNILATPLPVYGKTLAETF